LISPLEVKKHEFSRAVRGYDPTEVRNFLESVAVEVERMSETIRNQSSDLEKVRSELMTYQRMEQNMREAMVNVQETLKDAREGARKEADLMHREAELIAERIVTEARKKGENIRRELQALADRRDTLVRKLKTILRSELELIEMLEEEPDPTASVYQTEPETVDA
jgi:cell division initiation protein